MIGQLDIRQNTGQEGGLLNGATGSAIGEALATLVGFGELAFVIPAAAFDQVVYVRPIGAFCISINAQRGDLERAAMFLLVGQSMFADPVHFQRFIRGGSQESGFGQQPDLKGHQIPEDARKRNDDVDPGTTQFAQWDERGTRDATVTVEPG